MPSQQLTGKAQFEAAQKVRKIAQTIATAMDAAYGIWDARDNDGTIAFIADSNPLNGITDSMGQSSDGGRLNGQAYVDEVNQAVTALADIFNTQSFIDIRRFATGKAVE